MQVKEIPSELQVLEEVETDLMLELEMIHRLKEKIKAKLRVQVVKIRTGPSKKGKESIADIVRKIMPHLSDTFTPGDVKKKIKSFHPYRSRKISNSAVSTTLVNMKKAGQLKLIQKGHGSYPAHYSYNK